jgi:hypothetical protein
MSPARPIIRTYVHTELTCYLCGASAGSLERERDTRGAEMTFKPAGAGEPIQVAGLARLRCPRCGGGLYVDSVEIVDRRIEPLDWDEDDTPRRGRPPRWLVEQRRRHQAQAQVAGSPAA